MMTLLIPTCTEPWPEPEPAPGWPCIRPEAWASISSSLSCSKTSPSCSFQAELGWQTSICLYTILMKSQHLSFGSTPPQQQLFKSITFHSLTIAMFTWESSLELDIISSQVDILYFNGFIGHPGCQHMLPCNTVSVNDDLFTYRQYHPSI